MDDFSKEAIRRLPLAEAVLLLFQQAMSGQVLSEIWDEHRGRCYDKVITFPLMVRLIADALLTCDSGRESFERHVLVGTLEASVQAAYKKLSRLPVAVSQGLLQRSATQLRELFPQSVTFPRPASLQEFRLLIYDGKAVKHVAKRLKPVRGAKGGLVGGRALVVTDWESGLSLDMIGDLDGDANEVKHTGALLERVRSNINDACLHVADRAFSDLVQTHHFRGREQDHFLIRQQSKLKFHPDLQAQSRTTEISGVGLVVESWGHVGQQADPRRMYVRRLELVRSEQETITLITSLIDAEAYHVCDLLQVYRERWTIEQMFQKVTEVFGLSHLISTTPEATLFQFAFCMVLHNIVQVIRSYVAEAQACAAQTISAEKLFEDVTKQLTAWSQFITPQETEAYFSEPDQPNETSQRLQKLLKQLWSDRWRISPKQHRQQSPPVQSTRSHSSVQRLLHGHPGKPKKMNLMNLAKKKSKKQ